MRKIFIVMILAVIGLGLVAYLWLKEGDATAADTTAATANSVAALTVRFVDAALDEETGEYHLFFTCSEPQQLCVARSTGAETPHMGYAMMSLREVGLQTGDDRLVAKSAALLDDAIANCQDDQRYCEWNFFPLHLYHAATGDAKYLDAMLSVADNVTEPRPVRELINANIPVKWWRLYDATGDERYLEQLTALADEQLERYPTERQNDDLVYRYEGGEVRSFDLPIIWALYMPAFQASGDAKYLEPMYALFDNANLSAHTRDFFDVTATGNFLKGVESLIALAEATPERRDTYREEARRIVEIFLNERWDTPERMLANGDYGVFVSPSEKAVNMQGWLTHILLQLGDEPMVLELVSD